MSVYDTSLVEDNDREADFSEILEVAVDPLVKMCQHMVDIWSKGTGWEKNVFMANCGLYLQVCSSASERIHVHPVMQHVLESYSFTKNRQVELQKDIDGWVSALMQEHVSRLARSTGQTLTPCCSTKNY